MGRSKYNLDKQTQYNINWMLKDKNKGMAHPVVKELRQMIGRKSTLQRMIQKRQERIEKTKDEIVILNHELKGLLKDIGKERNKFDLNPYIFYNRGRNKDRVQGKIYWYDDKKGFGLRKGQKEGKNFKKHYFFDLGKMCESDEQWCREQYGDEWEYEIMKEDDWKAVCIGKFFKKFFPLLY